jgi:sec-independent protein translocase protein TatA
LAVIEGLFQPMHLLIILVIALVVVGPSKLGDVGGQLGRGVRDFKKAMSEIDEVKQSVAEVRDAVRVDGSAPAAGPAKEPTKTS